MAAHSATLRGAAQVFVVDKEPDRLALAEQIGATAINFAEADPVEAITDATDGAAWTAASRRSATRPTTPPARNIRRWCSTTWSRWSGPPAASAWSASTTRKIRAPRPKTPRRAGTASTTGSVFNKAITMGHGQCPVKRYNRQLRDLIIRGKASPR